MGNVTKMKNSAGEDRYRARYKTPERKQREKWFERKRDAEQWITDNEHSKATGSHADPKLGRLTFGSWWETWRATRVDLRASTIARDESYYRNHIEPRFARVQLARVDETMLDEWVAQLVASGLAPATVHKCVQLVSKCLASAVRKRRLAVNRAAGIELPTIERHEMLFLDPAQVATLADVIDSRYRTWIYTAAYSGLRLGELAALRAGSVDPMKRRIDVARTAVEVRGEVIDGPPKTKAGRRSVPIPGFVADMLTDHIAGLSADALVFTAPAGGYLRASLMRRRFFQPATIAAGFATMVNDDGKQRYRGLRIHDLRHTAVTFWIAAGASPKEVATWAGHSSVATVFDRYGHLLPGQEDKVMDKLDSMHSDAESTAPAQVIQFPG